MGSSVFNTLREGPVLSGNKNARASGRFFEISSLISILTGLSEIIGQ
jgi:hypothetical protein